MTRPINWRPHATRLAEQLNAAGVLDAAWRAAFAQTPRHLFVPRFFRDDDTIIDGDDPSVRKEWLESVYTDTTLVTRQVVAPGTNLMWPTSSSTRPSLMAYMLRLLEVADGQRVAEIGTGTGYHAALLCHRLGDQQVASVDIDPDAVGSAREALAGLGYQPHLVVGDGAAGIPSSGPYDRLIATCAVPAIPRAWIQQLTVGGILVTDLRGEITSSLLTARKTAADTIAGRFDTQAGHFMWLRADAANPLRDGGGLPASASRDGQQTTHTHMDPALFDNPDLLFLLQIRLPQVTTLGHTTRDGEPVLVISTPEDWVELHNQQNHGPRRVTYGGPNHLWQNVQEAVQLWQQLGLPARNRFGLTITADRQWVWLDHPGRPVPGQRGGGAAAGRAA